MDLPPHMDFFVSDENVPGISGENPAFADPAVAANNLAFLCLPARITKWQRENLIMTQDANPARKVRQFPLRYR